jgi:uncharacterized protein
MPAPKTKKRPQAKAANTCFLDSSAMIAIAFTSDQNHEEARRIFDELRFSGVLFVTTYFVFSEIMIYLRRRASIQTAITTGDRLLKSQQILIIDINSDQYSAAWEIFKKYRDWKDLSYTDCLSFAVMEEMSITRAFTFDSDFKAYGFTQLP